MDRPGRPRQESNAALEPIEEVVPSRAVLTELARGFLLLNGRDPRRASRFAATFLREQAAPRDDGPITPRLPSVRRSMQSWSRDEVLR